jgi:hypothetical protein
MLPSFKDGMSVDCDSKKRGHSCIHCSVSLSTQFNPPTAMNVDCDLFKMISAQGRGGPGESWVGFLSSESRAVDG